MYHVCKTSGGSRISHWGGANLRHVHFLAKMYAKTKEMDPVGGGGAPAAPPLDPPMKTVPKENLNNNCKFNNNSVPRNLAHYPCEASLVCDFVTQMRIIE